MLVIALITRARGGRSGLLGPTAELTLSELATRRSGLPREMRANVRLHERISPAQELIDAMVENYLAHGLMLRAGFPLAGMTPSAPQALPALQLDLVDPEALIGMWSGSEEPLIWRGRLGDGFDLTLARGIAGDFLFRYGDSAEFHLDQGASSLLCAPRSGSGQLGWQRALLTKILVCVSLLRGYEALHASAVSTGEAAVAIVAPSGVGKTTLALELMLRGMALISDDVLTLGDASGSVHAHPGSPHMNITDSAESSSWREEMGKSLGLVGGESWVTVEHTAHHSLPLQSIWLLERGPISGLEVQSLEQNPLRLAPYMLGLLDDFERERRRFALYGDVAAFAPLMQVTCGRDVRASDIADVIASRVRDQASPVASVGARR